MLDLIQRSYSELLEQLPHNDKGMEIRYSIPRAWIRSWRSAYGDDALDGLLESINDAPPAYLRINTCVTTSDEFCHRLDAAGVSYARISSLPNAVRVLNVSAVHNLPAAMATHYYFQDIASQWCCFALDARPGEKIADVCAAPGGKTMTIAQYMCNQGTVTAGELHDHKCRAMIERVSRYGFDCISVRQKDASHPPTDEEIGVFDRVVCDVPCSGLGVVRRKPEIRYKSPEEFADLPALQLQILEQSAKLVKTGGVLQYSTCTLRPEENEQVVSSFLSRNPDFEPRILPLTACFEQSGLPVSHQITLFPHIHGSDGFYVAGFTKKK